MTEERCKRMVSDSGGWHRYPCSRKAVKGGFCTQHHPDTEKARAQASRDKWKVRQAERDRSWERDRLHTVIAWLKKHAGNKASVVDLLEMAQDELAVLGEGETPQ